MLTVRNVAKVFGSEADRYTALSGISLHVSQGQFVCLLGPSGCGKLMDEPFAALDALTRRRMHGFLLDIWQRTGKTIVFVTHDIAEAVTMADRICLMSVGPGSRITEVIDVDLPRPRDLSEPSAARLFKGVEALLT